MGMYVTSCPSSGMIKGGTALLMSTRNLIGSSWGVAYGFSIRRRMAI